MLESGVICSQEEWKKLIVDHVPIFKWLPKYSVKKDLLADIIAGITVAVMHIPQGMCHHYIAYALKGNYH